MVLKFDASSLPVCLVTLKGQGLTQTQLHDIGQFTIRNQIAVVKGAEIPPPFGGKYRQAMVYVDPYKLLSRQLSLMDVVDAVNKNNLILPAGDVKMGPFDYYVYSNSLVKKVEELNNVPIKTVGQSWVSVGDIGEAKDANQIQYNIVRVDGQRSVYLPIMKQGGDTNTIQVVNGIRDMLGKLFDIPQAAEDRGGLRPIGLRQGGHQHAAARRADRPGADQPDDSDLPGQPARDCRGLSLHSAFRVGHVRRAVHCSGSTVNTMILGGLALAFSRVIDNSVISLENIYRHLEMGASPGDGGRAGRRRSQPGGAGRDADHGGGFLSRSRFSTASASFCSRRWRWRW